MAKENIRRRRSPQTYSTSTCYCACCLRPRKKKEKFKSCDQCKSVVCADCLQPTNRCVECDKIE